MDPQFKREGVRPISISVHPSRVLSWGYILFSSLVCFWINSHQRSTCARTYLNVTLGRKQSAGQNVKEMHMTGNQSFLWLINELPGFEADSRWRFDIKSPSGYDMMEVKLHRLNNSCDSIKNLYLSGKRSCFVFFQILTVRDIFFEILELWPLYTVCSLLYTVCSLVLICTQKKSTLKCIFFKKVMLPYKQVF